MEKKKHLLSVLVLLFATGSLVARAPLASKEQVGMFMNSTTCIVLQDGEIPYNLFIKNAVEKHWEITEYRFISMEEFEDLRSEREYSFLVLLKGEYENDPGGVSYDFLTLVMGGFAARVNDMPELGRLPVSYTGDEDADFGYAMPAMVQFLQRHVRVLQQKRLLISMLGKKYYNIGSNVRDKALLLDENHLAPDADMETEVRDAYPYYVELLSTDSLSSRLAGEPDHTIFLHHVGPNQGSGSGRCFEMVFDTKGHLFYFRSRMVTNDDPDGFGRKDLRKLR